MYGFFNYLLITGKKDQENIKMHHSSIKADTRLAKPEMDGKSGPS